MAQSKQVRTERAEFTTLLASYGVPESVALRLCTSAGTHHHYSERECNGTDWELGDLVPCPLAPPDSFNRNGAYIGEPLDEWCPECSGQKGGEHYRTSRTSVNITTLEGRIVRLLAPYRIEPVFSGDPRGCTVKLRLPDGRTNDWGNEGWCVPQ